MAASEATTDTATPGEKRKRSTRNLLLRGGSALAALALAYLCMRWDVVNGSGWAWALLIAAVTVPCLREFYRLAAGAGVTPFSALGYVAGPLWVVAMEWDLSGDSAAWLPVGPHAAWIVFLGICVGSMLLQLTRRTNDGALNNVALTIFGIVYCCVLPGLSLHLRHLRLDAAGWPMHGAEFAIVCIFVSKVADVGALLTGSRWGRHKMIPRLSPGKTWEGAAGGLLFSIFLLQFMTLTSPWMALAQLGWPMLALLSFLLAAAGMAGDLAESAFKRSSNQKDAGAGVPGFGGILDLVDSLMIATPVMYFFLVLCGAEYVKY